MKSSVIRIASLSLLACSLCNSRSDAQSVQQPVGMQRSTFINGPDSRAVNATGRQGFQGPGYSQMQGGQLASGLRQRAGSVPPTQNSGGNKSMPQYRYGAGVGPSSRQADQFGIRGGSASAAQGSLYSTYGNRGPVRSQQQWGQWSDWKPVTGGRSAVNSSCPTSSAAGDWTNRQSGFGASSGFTNSRVIPVGRDQSWSVGTSGSRSGMTTTRRRRRTTNNTSNTGNISGSGAAAGTTVDGFEVGSVGGP